MLSDWLSGCAVRQEATQNKLSIQVRALPERLKQDQSTMRDILIALDDRAVALILLVFSIPAIVPTPGIPAGMVFGSALAFIGLQMVFGAKRIRLPAGLSNLKIKSAQLERAVARIVPHLEAVEQRLRPRIYTLSTSLAARGIGLVVLLMAVFIALPIPFGNTLPGLAILILALGLSQRDGVVILAGLGFAIIAAAASLLLISGSWWIIDTYFGFSI